MPVMWFAKDGPRPNSQSEPGTNISIDEVRAILGVHEAKFFGSEPPSINSERPSWEAKNVIIEVETPSNSSDLLPNVGYYFVLGLKPKEAERILRSLRGEV